MILLHIMMIRELNDIQEWLRVCFPIDIDICWLVGVEHQPEEKRFIFI